MSALRWTGRLTVADLSDAADRLHPTGHRPPLMSSRVPPRVWAFRLPTIVTRANRVAQPLPDHADRTRADESLRSMSGFAVEAPVPPPPPPPPPPPFFFFFFFFFT